MSRWKRIEEGPYVISEDGQIFSEITKKYLSTRPRKHDGYVRKVLSTKDGQVGIMLHELIAKYFLGPKPEGCVINHKDGNKSNNHYTNLEYVTPSENTRHAMKLGLFKPYENIKDVVQKLTEREVMRIKHLINMGYSDTEIANHFGVHRTTISKIRNNKNWIQIHI